MASAGEYRKRKFRNLRFHYKGSFLQEGEKDGFLLLKYIGGRVKDCHQWPGDKDNITDLLKWIKENIPGSRDAKVDLYFFLEGQEGVQFPLANDIDVSYMWDEALDDSDGFTHLYVDMYPEASLEAFRELQEFKERFFNRAKSPPLTSSPNKKKKNKEKTTFGGDHHEYNTNEKDLHTATSQGSNSKTHTSPLQSEVAEVTEQLGDLGVEKGDLSAEKGENVGNRCALRSDNIIVVKSNKGGERVYDIDRVEDGDEYEVPWDQSDEDEVNYGEEGEQLDPKNDVRVDGRVENQAGDDVQNDENQAGDDVQQDGHITDTDDESGRTTVEQDVDISAIGDVITPEWDKKFLNDTARIEEEVQSDDDGKELQLWVGQTWENIKLCRDHLREYAIERKFAIILPKNNSDKIVAVCKRENCKFRVYVRIMNNGHTMRLRQLEKGHSCVGRTVTSNPTANAPYIAKKIEAQMRIHRKSFTPAQIMEHMWMYHNLEVKYWQAWNARTMALEAVHGSYEESYARVPELCRQVINTNPGSIATCSRDDNTLAFTSMCLMFKGSIEGFHKGCRPYIGLDGCHLSGKYGGHCLAIVGLDGENGMFPLAIYICVRENLDNWSKFLEQIAPQLEGRQLTIMSDRQKGLDAAVNRVFPGCRQRFCMRHITANMRQYHRGVEKWAWGASKSYKGTDFVKFMNLIKKNDKAAWNYLMNIPSSVWTRSSFDDDCKVEMVTNNISESFNAFILAARDKPIVMFACKLQTLLMKQMWERKCAATNWDAVKLCGLVPRAKQHFDECCKKIKEYSVGGCDGNQWQVSHWFGNPFRVNLEEHVCSCMQWQVTGMPCVHAVAIIEPRMLNPLQYFSPYYSIETFKQAYSGCIYPILGENDWPENDEVIHPPERPRAPGRPRVSRIRGANEGRLPTDQVHNRCGSCGGYNHNRRTCQGGTPNDPLRRRRGEQKRNKGGRPRVQPLGYRRPGAAENIARVADNTPGVADNTDGVAGNTSQPVRRKNNSRWRAKKLVNQVANGVESENVIESVNWTHPERRSPLRIGKCTRGSKKDKNVIRDATTRSAAATSTIQTRSLVIRSPVTRSKSAAATIQTRSKDKGKQPLDNLDGPRGFGRKQHKRKGGSKSTYKSQEGQQVPSEICDPPMINVPFKKPRLVKPIVLPELPVMPQPLSKPTIQQKKWFNPPDLFPFRGTSNSNMSEGQPCQKGTQSSSTLPPWKP